MCKKLMALHVLELIEQSLQETLKRSERIADADDFWFPRLVSFY